MASVSNTGNTGGVAFNWGSFGLDQKQLEDLQTKFAAGQFAPLPMGDAVELAHQLGMAPPLDMNIGDVFALVAALKTKVEETSLDITTGEVKRVKEEQKTKSQERMDKLNEQCDKMNEAKKGGLVGEIFGWIAAAAMAIAGAIMIATGVGAAAGVALLAAGITMLVTQTLTSPSLGQAFGLEGNLMGAMSKGITDALVKSGAISPEDAEKVRASIEMAITVIVTAVAAIAGTIAGGPALGISLAASAMSMAFTPENLEAFGVPEDKAGWVAMGISIGLAVVGIASGLAASGAADKIAKAATQLASKVAAVFADTADDAVKAASMATSLIDDAAKVAADTAKTVAEVSDDAAKAGADIAKATVKEIIGRIASSVSLMIGAFATIGQGASMGVTTSLNYQAKGLEADAAEMKGQLAMIAALMQRKSEDLEDILKRIQENASAVMQVINGTAETAKSVIDINNRPLGA